MVQRCNKELSNVIQDINHTLYFYLSILIHSIDCSTPTYILTNSFLTRQKGLLFPITAKCQCNLKLFLKAITPFQEEFPPTENVCHILNVETM